jgi:GT2 family glycosyltransferase
MDPTVKLSVVIVNYNVRYFLEQCLKSVEQAGEALRDKHGSNSLEVFVVDNHSVDDSMEMCQQLFPWVHRIELNENIGFSRGNNLAIRKAKGQYILLLNPDTVVERSTFISTVEFMDLNAECGGLGVRMVDGSGRFLPESKRGLPTPAVAFYKMFGLATIFPRSKRFGKYHLGYLPPDQIHEVDVLSGAFMMLRSTTLDKVGLLDETFFMYGEDIDLSYRIQQGGWKNFYFPDTTIIHYKGESTKKRSVNYVVVFYKAMVIFAEKHFSQGNAGVFRTLIHFAILFRASLALVRRAVEWLWMPLIDVVALIGFFLCFSRIWARMVTYPKGGHYPDLVDFFISPGIAVVFVLMVGLNGGYRKPFKWVPWIRGAAYGMGLVLLLYGLLPESLRFGRSLVLLGAATSMAGLTLLRGSLGRFFPKGPWGGTRPKMKHVLLIGSTKEENRILPLLSASGQNINYVGRLDAQGEVTQLGSLADAEEILEIKKIDEVIFCAADLAATSIISKMTSWESKNIEFKIAPPNSAFIIGSQSIHSPGEWYLEQISTLAQPSVRRQKRTFDIAICLILPFLGLVLPGKLGKRKMLKHWAPVLMGRETWVGYAQNESQDGLPSLPPSVFGPGGPEQAAGADYVKDLNIMYARNYSVAYDWKVLMDSW